MKDEDFDKVLDTNLRGAFVFLREAAKIMARQRHGRIINISSVVGQMGNAGQINYSAAKAGLIGMTKSAAKELAPKKIRVNAIAPGLTNTAMMQQADPEKLQSRINNICMGRLAQPEDIAGACMFMLSDLSAYVSGQILAVDGCTIM
jgi:3-oxoacyl-[acyl-carrier protein] reductase